MHVSLLFMLKYIWNVCVTAFFSLFSEQLTLTPDQFCCFWLNLNFSNNPRLSWHSCGDFIHRYIRELINLTRWGNVSFVVHRKTLHAVQNVMKLGIVQLITILICFLEIALALKVREAMKNTVKLDTSWHWSKREEGSFWCRGNWHLLGVGSTFSCRFFTRDSGGGVNANLTNFTNSMVFWRLP